MIPPAPDLPLPLLGGLTPRQFMSRHWHKKPLLVRGAVPGFVPPLDRKALFDLAGREGVESRLVSHDGQGWRLRHGPFARRGLPGLAQPRWTLLVQGVDLHSDPAHELMGRFRFIPDARLDDLMVSWASPGGGVGPHFDSYDVFLLQATGQRRWRIGRQRDLSLQPGVPLKILQHFEPEQEWVLNPGDMLYLPPRWAHDGDAVGGDCMTCSIGFRSPQRGGLASELALRLADEHEDTVLYRDPAQLATDAPARVPAELQAFADEGLRRLLARPEMLGCVLGEVLTEPKPTVWFDEPAGAWQGQALCLDRRTRMMYDDKHVFINGESLRAGGADARLMRRLADRRRLSAAELARAGRDARQLLGEWFEAGWVRADDTGGSGV